MTDTTYEANGDTVWAINGWLGPDAPEDNQQGDFKLITVCDEITDPIATAQWVAEKLNQHGGK